MHLSISPGQVCLLQALLSSEFPLQSLPDMHLLLRVSVPRPHVTEHDQGPQVDHTTKHQSMSNQANNIIF